VRVESYLLPRLGAVALRGLTGDDVRRYRLALEQELQLLSRLRDQLGTTVR
jgi:hypothetical protein